MLSQAASFLVETVVGLFSLALLLRFYLQLVRAPYRNPISQFLCALTDFVVVPARRVIPGLWGIDLASLTLAWLCEALLLFLLLALRGAEPVAFTATAVLVIFVLAAVKILKVSIYILMVAVIVQAILSWVNPYNEMAGIFNAVTRPFLAPIRRFLPVMGGLDLSPLVLLVILQLLFIPLDHLQAAVREIPF